jgi:hypothetical protein
MEEINLNLISVVVKAKVRKLRVKWSVYPTNSKVRYPDFKVPRKIKKQMKKMFGEDAYSLWIWNLKQPMWDESQNFNELI